MKVDAVEPAAWRPGADSDVVYRLRGEHLQHVVGVKLKHKGIRVTRVKAEDDEHVLVTLHISGKADPGALVLQVYTRYMTTFATLPMTESSAAAPRAEGGTSQ